MEDDVVLVTSDLSQNLEEDGYFFEVHIYRLEADEEWTLEVVDQDGTSHVWDGRFSSDFGAMVEAQKTIRTEGPRAFMYGDEGELLH